MSGLKKNLIEFRAGILKREGNMVVADKRKGLIYMHVSEEMLQLCWKERKAGSTPEIELILFPEDAVFEHVPQCTTGRVFVLRILSAELKYFFWMQEPKTDRDEEYTKIINRLIATSGASSDITNVENDLAQDQLYTMLQNVARSSSNLAPSAAAAAPPSSSAPAPSSSASTSAQTKPSTTSSSSGIGISQLQSILSNIQVPEQRPDADLTKILTHENVSSLLSDPDVQQALFPFLPEKAERTKEELEDIIRSPQFVQAVATLNAGLQSGQMAPLLAELGIDPSVAGPLGGVEDFLRALQRKSQKK